MSSSMVLRSVHLPPELDEQLRMIAFDLRLSKADLIRAFVQHGLRVLRPALAEARTPEQRTALIEELSAARLPEAEVSRREESRARIRAAQGLEHEMVR